MIFKEGDSPILKYIFLRGGPGTPLAALRERFYCIFVRLLAANDVDMSEIPPCPGCSGYNPSGRDSCPAVEQRREVAAREEARALDEAARKKEKFDAGLKAAIKAREEKEEAKRQEQLLQVRREILAERRRSTPAAAGKGKATIERDGYEIVEDDE